MGKFMFKITAQLAGLVAFGTLAATSHAMLPTPTTSPTQVIATIGMGASQLNQAPTLAQNAQITPMVYAFLVSQTAEQTETLTPLTTDMSVPSGAVVEYHAYFVNQTGERIRKMTATLDIPAGAELVGAVSPTGANASIDGALFSRMPLRTQVDGQIQEIPLPWYRALSWQVEDVGIGGVFVAKYRAKIS